MIKLADKRNLDKIGINECKSAVTLSISFCLCIAHSNSFRSNNQKFVLRDNSLAANVFTRINANANELNRYRYSREHDIINPSHFLFVYNEDQTIYRYEGCEIRKQIKKILKEPKENE